MGVIRRKCFTKSLVTFLAAVFLFKHKNSIFEFFTSKVNYFNGLSNSYETILTEKTTSGKLAEFDQLDISYKYSDDAEPIIFKDIADVGKMLDDHKCKVTYYLSQGLHSSGPVKNVIFHYRNLLSPEGPFTPVYKTLKILRTETTNLSKIFLNP